MLVSTPAIVLSSLKYGEADLIARLYTRGLGTQSFMVKGVRKSRKGGLRVSFFQPLTQLVIVTQFKGKGTLEYIKEAQVTAAYGSIHQDIAKSSIVMFFSELLTQLLVEQQPDEDLYDYLQTAFQLLDHEQQVANFSIKVLLDLTGFLGFKPDASTMDKPYFNLLHGSFDNNGMLPHHATDSESALLKSFLGISFDTMHCIKMSREDRNSLLNLVTDYFQIHLHAFKKPVSLAMLKQLFDS
jgi:DNA repair protein RecO (recombination protein O)